MKRHVASMSTSSGSHRLSNEIDIDIKLYEALGKNVVFALNKIGDLITKIVSTSYMMLEDVDKSSCTSSSSESDELSDDDGIAFGPYPSGLFYDEENTNLNPRYGLDRDNSGAYECEVRYAAY